MAMAIRRSSWLWCAAAVGVLGLAALGVWRWYAPPSTAPAPATATVEAADITQRVVAAAVVQPRVKLDVSAQVSGQIRMLHVQPGDAVREGDLLVSLHPELADNEVLQAQGHLAQHTASLASRRIDLAQAQREAERQRKLMQGQATSGSELDKAETDLAKLQSELAAMEASMGRYEADLANARLKRNFTRVLAPMNGEVASIAVQKGQTVNANYQSPLLMTLAQLDVVSIRTLVPEADIASVRVGQAASFTTLGDSQREHRGQVRLIQPLPEKVNGGVFYVVLFDVPNTGPSRSVRPLMSDMTGQVRIEVARVQGVPSLPSSALGNRAPDGSFTVRVLQAGSGPQAVVQERRVRIGVSDGQRVQVREGLQIGEQVLLSLGSAATTAPIRP